MPHRDEPNGRPTTEQWARRFGVSTSPTPPVIEACDEPCPLTAEETAVRAVVLQGVAAVAFGVDSGPVVDWCREQEVWDQVSPKEQAFLLVSASLSGDERMSLRWRAEAEWALLWAIGKVESLGLPTRRCDSRRLVDEIIPALGTDLKPFATAAELRPSGLLLAEDDRHYELWCRYFQARREGQNSLPRDLEWRVLYERRYAFEWLNGIRAWDDIRCDA